MTRGIPMVSYWCGLPIEELSREQLIDALNWCGAEIERMREQAAKEREFMFSWLDK
jgi:hypothetical protein